MRWYKNFYISFFIILAVAAGVFLVFNFKKNVPIEDKKTETVQKEIAVKNEMLEGENKIVDKGKDASDESEEAKETEPARNATHSVAGEEKRTENELPKNISIQVPFSSQAPFAKWDEVHEETCEEASLLMVKYYLDGKKLTPEIAEKELQAMVKFQNEKRGDFKDTDAKETARLGKDFYGIENFQVVYDFSKEDLKKQLALGRPIIVPTAGRRLGNPNFTAPGPLYHMLVLTGYDGNFIITNDPGTRKGENYRYDLNVLYAAIHDFPGRADEIESGRKAMIVLE